jgi:hypothetical protein
MDFLVLSTKKSENRSQRPSFLQCFAINRKYFKNIFKFDFWFYLEMNRGIKILLFFLAVLWGNLFSQQLSNQVIVSAAGVAAAGNLNYSHTIGESVIEIISSPDFILTQGFQQPGIKLTLVDPPKGNGVNVYPNPASDFIKVELFGEVARTFRIEMINMNGIFRLIEKVVFTDKFFEVKEFDITDLSSGFYLVRVMSEDGFINRTFTIEKI